MSPPVRQIDSPKYVSPEDYLRREREAEYKHEYFNGEVRAVTGASYAHNLICANLTAIISRYLRGTTSNVVGSNQRLHVTEANAFCYPDLAVIHGTPEFLDDQTQENLLNPTLLVQIVTPTAEGWAGRFGLYRQLPGLQQFVLLHSPLPYAEWYWRDEQGRWLLTDTNARPGVLDLCSIGCQVPLAEVYKTTD
ncbi:Uma2 family endonuclease [Hymenobacter antarcticus]|uniref:Uma2 family endonuclease n=1 Tax=Hymenobacter antarcticus TaxID=486270 RepID=A0ABP7P082_9BACT